MPKWIYVVGGMATLTLTLSSGYFVGQHLLWVRTFGWPILSDAGLATFSVACVGGLMGTGLMIRKLVESPRDKSS